MSNNAPDNIIKTQADIAAASTPALVATYNWLTGKTITRFSSRAAGEVQVANAMLQALDRAGHKGVPKGAKPDIAAGALGGAAQPAAKEEAPAPRRNPLESAVATLSAGKVRVKNDKPPRKTARPAIQRVKAMVKGGESKMQEASVRHAVYEFIAAGENRTRAIEDIDAHFNRNCRGFVQKLMEKKHVQPA